MALAGVVFDYSVLLGPKPAAVGGELKQLLDNIRGAGLQTVVLSTHRKNINAQLAAAGLPHADHVLFRADDRKNPANDEVSANKGSPQWMTRAAQLIGCPPYQLVNIGDEHCDWTGAIGAAVLHLHAGWVCPKPDDVHSHQPNSPTTAWLFLTHFLQTPSRFKFSLDLPGPPPVHFRSLYTSNSNASLPATTPSKFTLIQIFTDDRRIDVKVGPIPGGDLLMTHALTSLYEEGLIDPHSRFTIYPGHTPGSVNPTLAGYINFLSKYVKAYERDLIVRGKEAPDTSKERRAGKAVGFQNQTDTVYLNPEQKKNIRNKSVIVFDDFTTDGNGLDWARLLLSAGGAGQVVLVTIGKFVRGGSPTQLIHRPASGVTINPYELTDYGPDAFVPMHARLNENDANAVRLGKLFEAMRDLRPFEASE